MRQFHEFFKLLFLFYFFSSLIFCGKSDNTETKNYNNNENKTSEKIYSENKITENNNDLDNYFKKKDINSGLINIELLDVDQTINRNLGYKGPVVFEFKITNNIGVDIKELSIKAWINGKNDMFIKTTIIKLSNLKKGDIIKKEKYFYDLATSNVYKSDIPWIKDVVMSTEKLVIDNTDFKENTKYLFRYFNTKSFKKSIPIKFL